MMLTESYMTVKATEKYMKMLRSLQEKTLDQ